MSPQFKSKTQQQYVSVQTINLVKSFSNFCSSKKIKGVFRLRFAALVAATLFLGSCQKEQVAEPVVNSTSTDGLDASASGNTAPKVSAGPIRRLVYPSSTTTLSGTGSDADGSVTFKWTQVGGNSNATIATPTKATTDVSGLKPGVYTFVLTVTDSKGASRRDTTYVTVLQKMTWTIEGTTREALVHPPTDATSSSPIIFAYHGRGGTDLGFAERAFEINWPQAIVVYPQALRDGSKDAAWQGSVGESSRSTGVKDQDIKFFDAMVSTLKSKYSVNTNYIFAHGWSNGGEFIYNVLWSARGDKLAGLSPAGATLNSTSGKRPVAVIHVAGTKDDKVSFSKQQQSISSDRGIDKCSSTSTTWCTGPSSILGKKYPSSIDEPVVSLQYDGGHNYPFSVPPFIVQFFKDVAGAK